MGKRYNREPSDAQLNAEALARRGSSFTEASGQSFSVAWNFHNREPKNLRDAVITVRNAYGDEIPTRLHEGYDSIGEGGTPKMDVRFEAYLTSHPETGLERRDPETGAPVLDYYRWPFRAALHKMARGDTAGRHHARIVFLVAVAQMSPAAAAREVGVPFWCASEIAERAIRSFLHRLSDVKVDIAKSQVAA